MANTVSQQLNKSLPAILQQYLPQKRPATAAIAANVNRSLLINQQNKKPKLAQMAPKDNDYGINFVDSDSLEEEYGSFLAPKITSVTSLSSATKDTDNITSDMSYKEKYERTAKELFECRKLVNEQKHAIKQLQGEIDFLNQLLKEK
jgi:hypothetical protein